MKAWHAALAALVFLSPKASTAAADLPGAARELAHRTSGLVRGPVTATYRNLSSLPDSQINEVRREFEAALTAPVESAPAAEARITLSENATEFLLVEEIHKGEESEVWITGWNRSGRKASAVSGAALEKKLIWEQDEPILDIAILPDGLVVLTPSRITIQPAQGGTRVPQSVALAPAELRPRDVRGRVHLTGGRIQASLPGIACEGAVEALSSIRCQGNDEPWVLESGSYGILLANFTVNRNYFDGRVVTQSGVRKTVAPFYSAADVEEEGSALWLLALVDGRTQIFDKTLEPLTSFSGWGSDLVGISWRCGGGSAVLATRPSDANEPDAVQAFSLMNRAPVPLGASTTFPGPVTALWPSGPASALAVSRDLATGKYAAYVLTMVCSP